jgi:hypothetical protein
MRQTGQGHRRPPVRRWRGRAAAALAAAGLAAAGLAVAGCGTAAAAGPAAGSPAGAGGGVRLAAGQAAGRPAVPWSRVGPGWVLAEYWNGRYAEPGPPRSAPASLYLVSPAGGRYLLYRTAVTSHPPTLIDWSGDKARALLQTAAPGGMEQVTLATGRVTPVRLPAQASVIGYTRPSGLNLLAWRQLTGSRVELARYRLTGALTRVLGGGPDLAGAVDSADGTVLAVAAGHGLQLVSNSGRVIRTLPVPGAACSPARWWNATTILAACHRGDAAPQLWLVPAGRGTARALTPPRGPHSPDLGDIGAWPLPGGLYLQGLGPCGTVQIFRQAASGSISLVSVPHTAGNNRVLTAHAGQLLVQAPTGCSPTATLLWFNPVTRHVTTLFASGVLGAAPFYQVGS